MSTLRVLAIGAIGVAVGVLGVVLLSQARFEPPGPPGSNPGLDRASRSGAEIRLKQEGETCRLTDKTRTIRAKVGYRVVWNVFNECPAQKLVALNFVGVSPVEDGSLSVTVGPQQVGTINVRVRPVDWTGENDDKRTHPYTVTVDGSTIDPDLIIDRR